MDYSEMRALLHIGDNLPMPGWPILAMYLLETIAVSKPSLSFCKFCLSITFIPSPDVRVKLFGVIDFRHDFVSCFVSQSEPHFHNILKRI
jgi:hypothetical protein